MTVEFIAEFTTNHMGNLNLALEMARKAKEAGATYIKMQKKDVETFYTKEKLDKEYLSPYGNTYRDYRKIFEFDQYQMYLFDLECYNLNIPWYMTVQDVPSVSWLLQYYPNVDKVKFSSSNLRNLDLLEYASGEIPETKEIVLSTAGATLAEIEVALNYFRSFRKVWLLHCVAEYPTKLENLRLGNIPVLKETFGDAKIHIGYSDHSKGESNLPAWTAIYLGAEMIERHFCLSRHSFVHHIDCSSEPEEFKSLVRVGSDTESIRAFKPWFEFLLKDKPFGDTSFGMTEMEKSFLVDQTYGDDYLGKESIIK